MSDGMGRDSSDSRAENALRAAFERVAAEDGTPGALDGPAIRRRARTRSAGMIAGAAAAVLLLVGGVVGAVQLTRDAAAPANDPADQTETSAIEAPAKGWRFEYYRDVRLQVPDSWGYDREPGSDWCADVPGGMVPKRPYVARLGASRGHVLHSLLSPRRPPVSTWVDHVTLSDDKGDSSVDRVGNFWVVKEPVGHTTIKVVSTDRALADRIVASAEIVEPGDPSCDPSSDIQSRGFQRPSPPFDIATVDGVDAILVCQYELGIPPGSPGLIAQHELIGAAADAELKALQSAPLGGGPDQPHLLPGRVRRVGDRLAPDAWRRIGPDVRLLQQLPRQWLRRRYGDQSVDPRGMPAAHPAAGRPVLRLVRALRQVRTRLRAGFAVRPARSGLSASRCRPRQVSPARRRQAATGRTSTRPAPPRRAR